MLLGIDFGTTRTIVASADRGNYPVVSFIDDDGDTHEFFPSVLAEEDGEILAGFSALASAGKTGQVPLRSFKRLLASPTVSPESQVQIGTVTTTVLGALTEFLSALRAALETSSNAGDLGHSPRAVVAVPAHAHSAQRFITLEAFRAAGFDVVGMINEPSAAGFEYTHRQGGTLNSRRTRVLVYDLGGGTFDASLVAVDGGRHEVLGSVGINRLGGDDFDDVLVDLAASSLPGGKDSLVAADLSALAEDARAAKERVTPQTRRLPLEVAGQDVDVAVPDFYDGVEPLIERTLTTMADLVGGLGDSALAESDVAGIYLVGGASGLPIVPRLLRARFGRRVHRSPYPAASTAIGLAIAGDGDAGYTLEDRLSRGFGVFRELQGGTVLGFDPILLPETRTSSTVTRRYRSAHNLGHYRFIEFASLTEMGSPAGDLVPLEDVFMPFDRALQDGRDLSEEDVVRTEEGTEVEERYEVDEAGMITVTITDLDTGYSVSRTLGG